MDLALLHTNKIHHRYYFLFFIFIALFFSLNVQADGKGGFGTGFFVNSDGYIMTANHVIGDRPHVLVRLSGDKALLYQAEVIKADRTNDLALIRIKKSSMPLRLADWESVPIGLEVCTIGFNLVGFIGASMKITQGLINADEGVNGQKTFFQLSAEVEKGNSGGPAIGPDGLVVGIVQQKLNALSVAERTQDLPQNVNFGLKSQYISRFLEQTPAAVDVYSVNLNLKLKPYEIYKMSKDSIVMVISADDENFEKYRKIVKD